MPTLASRFELPALNLNFGSITDGTDIPPPPDSPVLKVPTPPQTPPPAEENNKKVVKQVNEESKPASTNEGQLQSNGSLTVVNGARPSSQSGSSFMDDRKSKRTSGWFRRIRTGDSSSKRASTVFEAAPPTPTFNKKPSGPPPPMIPEMADLEKDEGSLGADLFKNIK
ncbi:hypothetical protein AUP68_05795 [Ilyonectria robusta]